MHCYRGLGREEFSGQPFFREQDVLVSGIPAEVLHEVRLIWMDQEAVGLGGTASWRQPLEQYRLRLNCVSCQLPVLFEE